MEWPIQDRLLRYRIHRIDQSPVHAHIGGGDDAVLQVDLRLVVDDEIAPVVGQNSPGFVEDQIGGSDIPVATDARIAWFRADAEVCIVGWRSSLKREERTRREGK